MLIRKLLLFLIITSFVSFPQNGGGYEIFLLKESAGTVYLEPLHINERESISLRQNEFITFILPVGPGKSGDIIQSNGERNTVKVSASSGELAVSVTRSDGSERLLPPVKADDLSNYLIRVNVISGKGLKKAFFINNYSEYGEADGPVFDLFGGKIPLADDDYSVTTEVTESKKINYISGSAPLETYDNLLFVKGMVQDGAEGYFIIDFGAGRTVISSEFVPSGNKISEIRSIEYSPEGTKTSKGEIGAVGGNVSGLLGNTVISKLTFGSLELREQQVSVLDKLPVIAGKKITGIIGIDILQKAPVVSIEYNYGNPGKIIFKSGLKTTGDYINIPFSLTGRQIFINGQINGRQVEFLFDTGARYSFISEGLGLITNDKYSMNVRGLDGNIITAKNVEVKDFSLGKSEFGFRNFYSADLPVINNIGLNKTGALLGGDFFKSFKKVIVDFSSSVIRIDK